MCDRLPVATAHYRALSSLTLVKCDKKEAYRVRPHGHPHREG